MGHRVLDRTGAAEGAVVSGPCGHFGWAALDAGNAPSWIAASAAMTICLVGEGEALSGAGGGGTALAAGSAPSWIAASAAMTVEAAMTICVVGEGGVERCRRR